MHADTSPTTPTAVAERATFARLTLELRAALEEAAAAEALELSIDVDGAVQAVREELADQVARRRLDLAATVEVARREAQASIDAARRRAAARLVDRAATPVTVVSIDEWPTVEVPLVVAGPDATSDDPPDVSPTPTPSAVTVALEPAAFAELLAAAMATALAEHLPDLIGTAGTARRRAAPRTELRHARHLDVFLVVVAALIVLVVLASWLS